jgi:hypothetical protein
MQHANIKLAFLYRMTLTYSKGWSINLAKTTSSESQHFFLAEGNCKGRISGSFQAANHPLQRHDGTFIPDIQGVIETEDGAVIYFDHHGYGRTYPEGRRQIIASGTHLSDADQYAWLNDTVAVGVGEVRVKESGGVEIVIDWSEVLWDTIPE